jgi:hypothetical protein
VREGRIPFYRRGSKTSCYVDVTGHVRPCPDSNSHKVGWACLAQGLDMYEIPYWNPVTAPDKSGA